VSLRGEPRIFNDKKRTDGGKEGGTAGPLNLLYAPAPLGSRKSARRAGPFQEGGNRIGPAHAYSYIPRSTGFKREGRLRRPARSKILGLRLGRRRFFHGHRRGFLPRYLRGYP
jgi:hypothetical protein